MAKEILNNAFVSVNGVDLSDHARTLNVNDTRDQVDLTGMGAGNKIYGKGLGDGTMTIEFFQDFAGGSVHATLQPLIGSSTNVTIIVKRDQDLAISATNPAITMIGTLFNYDPLAATVGEASMISATFQNGDQSGIVYDITP